MCFDYNVCQPNSKSKLEESLTASISLRAFVSLMLWKDSSFVMQKAVAGNLGSFVLECR